MATGNVNIATPAMRVALALVSRHLAGDSDGTRLVIADFERSDGTGPELLASVVALAAWFARCAVDAATGAGTEGAQELVENMIATCLVLEDPATDDDPPR